MERGRLGTPGNWNTNLNHIWCIILRTIQGNGYGRRVSIYSCPYISSLRTLMPQSPLLFFFTYSSALSSHFTWCCLLALVVSTLVMYTLSYHSSILSMWSNHHSMVCLTLSLNQHKAFKSPNNAMIIFTQKLIQIISKGLHTPSFFGETISRLVLWVLICFWGNAM